MSDNNISDLIKTLSLKDTIKSDEIPDLDLYMDQVITLFENKLSHSKRNETDKLLTKTMINNYAKDKLLLPIVNKKYSRENIILLILIFNLKQSLSIADIKTILSNIGNDDINLIDFYNKYFENTNNDFDDFTNELSDVTIDNDSTEELSLLILSLINKSNMYKKLALDLLDNCITKDDTPKK
ncbi:DUF1836 domain-containing protein [Inconstantimicrobium mannanitabidum]|uniref:Uncharacterized protein n=1 Tax=Inconstantimicrobium mannanitabidum TaxID=1604901 RepID=A0ACB5RD43_9CLOT|nr:DUF1836 domain-containing protein [Clostridium sp. TW13]GKX67010.1 hypothetical protein rsdtw13_22680 [Clostridium sp. TW13]